MCKRIINYRIKILGMKSGFTLAEVLITLTIIGVIAALTIPSLITNIQDAQNRTAWKSAASIVSQATRKLATDNGGSLNGVFNNNNDVRDKLSNYLSYTKKCNAGNALGSDNCWSSQIYNLSGSNFTWWDSTSLSQFSRLVLNNGMLSTFDFISGNCTYNRAAKQNGCAMMAIDVNGFRGPNIIGKDIYWGYITEDGSFEPFGKQGDHWNTLDPSVGCDLNANLNAIGFTCAAQYLYQ